MRSMGVMNSWALMDDAFSMDGVMPSLWGYTDTIEELQQKLLYKTEEFKCFQITANETIKKQAEYIDGLVQILKITSQERDEARDQLHLLLNKLMPLTPVEPSPLANNYLQPETPRIIQSKNNSSMIESDSNSPVESFFDTVTSPDISNINMVSEYNSNSVPKFDQAYARIEHLVTKKPLPEKGKLVSAIMDAGPLLQTLLIAGPLPRWRNPPTLQPLVVPPISIKSPNKHAIVSPSILLSGSYRKNPEGNAASCLSAKRQKSN